MILLLLTLLSVPQATPVNPLLTGGSPPCSTGVSDAPCLPANLRTVIVASDGSGNHTNLQAALDTALPGDSIFIKPGSYGAVPPKTFIIMRVSGTRTAPIFIGPYDPKRPPTITSDFQIGEGTSVVGGQWTIVEGLTFTSVNSQGSGIRAFADSVTLRRNRFYNNKYQGIWQDGSNQLVEENEFSNNGAQGPGVGCMGQWGLPENTSVYYNPSHCHGIYAGVVYPVDPLKCRTPHHVTIRRNRFTRNSGSGFQIYINGSYCKDPTWGRKAHDYLIENNIFEDNEVAMFIVGFAQSEIRNNTIILRSYVTPTHTQVGFLDWYDVPASTKIYNNLFYSTVPDSPPNVAHFSMTFADTSRTVLIDHNAYFVKTGVRFRGNFTGTFQAYTSMLTKWKSVSGKDTNGFVVDVDVVPHGMVNPTAGDYHLLANSPMVNAGDPNNCPAVDYDGKPRSGRCDIGAFEFLP